jgi:precorrin-6Y C5,15-methyltransferase (decarboxylating)
LSVPKIHIIGIGDDGAEGLASAARTLIEQADLVIGPPQTLSLVAGGRQRLDAGSDPEVLVKRIGENAGQRVVVLASGDPLSYGVARYLCDHLGKDRFEVVPHVSSMQLAFARVKESWDEAYLANLAHAGLDRVVEKIRTAEKVGLFTTESCPPHAVARALLDRKIDYFSVYVCENLGSPDERVTQGELAEVARQEFSPLNVMILTRKPGIPDRPTELVGQRLFGNPDESFLQVAPKRDLITPADVRVIALSLLDLGPSSIMWDVGAGSGSVAIEAAKIAAAGTAYAIEMDAEDHQLIRANAERFGVPNLVPVLGAAPDSWADLPDPHAIFVGGTGRAVSRISQLAFPRLRHGGRLVVNVSSINNLSAVHGVLRQLSGNVTARMVNIAVSTDQLDSVRFEAMNPTFLIAAVRE